MINNETLSENTLDILKSFSAINPSIVIKPGKSLRTISNQKTIMAVANCEDEFVSTAGIFDLSKFLGTVSLFEKPKFDCNEKVITIHSGREKVNYTLAESSMIIQPPDKNIGDIMPSPDVSLDVTWADLQKVLKAAATLSLPEISFTGNEEGIVLEAIDSKNPTSDKYGTVVGENPEGTKFNLYIKVENLKLMPGNYKVSLSTKGLSSFVNDKVSYLIAVESKSTYGG